MDSLPVTTYVCSLTVAASLLGTVLIVVTVVPVGLVRGTVIEIQNVIVALFVCTMLGPTMDFHHYTTCVNGRELETLGVRSFLN